jgi:hypothetical protein
MAVPQPGHVQRWTESNVLGSGSEEWQPELLVSPELLCSWRTQAQTSLMYPLEKLNMLIRCCDQIKTKHGSRNFEGVLYTFILRIRHDQVWQKYAASIGTRAVDYDKKIAFGAS